MENNLREKIEYEYKSLSKTHRIIADLYLNDKVTRTTTLVEVAQLGYCSHSTVLRFIHMLGYQNFRVFMADYFNDNQKSKSNIIQSFTLVDEYIDQSSYIIDNFVNEIIAASNVYIFASGMSYVPAYNFFYKCNLATNKFVIYNELPSDVTISNDDLVIFISNSGNSRKLRVLSNHISDYCLITNIPKTTLSKKAKLTVALGNNLESHHKMDTEPRESIYTLIYFLDELFSIFQSKSKLNNSN